MIINRTFVSIAFIAAAMLFVFFGYTSRVFGEPASVSPRCTLNSVASTSPVYMSAGQATTTMTCDLFGGGGLQTVPDGALLGIQLTASSSASKIAWRTEYSMGDGRGCAAGFDYYPQSNALTSSATTTTYTEQFGVNEWRAASSSVTTQGLAFSETTSRGYQAFSIQTPLRCVKITFYVPIGAAAGALWAELFPRKQITH